MLPVEEQMNIIRSGAARIISEDELKRKLEKGRPLVIKLGVDPTAPDLHLGHAVALRKIRQFQDLGHRATLIIGSATALIGDPSGKNTTRPQLTHEEVEHNAETYVTQAARILDPERTTVVYNGDWIFSLNLKDLLSLASRFTVARILERDDFIKRYTAQTPIALHEFFYPVLQAYDSVEINADVELGGTDQLFNLLAGRELMGKMNKEPQVALIMPLLEGTDGVRKMSKSYGNYVGLTDDVPDMYGKIMSIPDTMIGTYYRLASTCSVDEVDHIVRQLEDGSADPYALKRALARNICDLYHGAGAGEEGERAFDALFKQHAVPADIPEFSLDLVPNEDGTVYLAKLLVDAGIAHTTGEARRLVDGGGVKVNGEVVPARAYTIARSKLTGATVQVGKRRFVRLV